MVIKKSVKGGTIVFTHRIHPQTREEAYLINRILIDFLVHRFFFFLLSVRSVLQTLPKSLPQLPELIFSYLMVNEEFK